MQPSSRFTAHRSPRMLLYGLLFVALVGMAGMVMITGPDALAAPAPPDTTIPPGTLPKPDGPPLSGIINILHLAPVAADLDDTAVVICNDADDSLVGGPLRYGEQSGYLNLFFGNYDWYVAGAAGGCDPGSLLLDLDPFTMRGNAKLSLVIFGGANTQPLDSVLIIEAFGLDVNMMPIFIQQP